MRNGQLDQIEDAHMREEIPSYLVLGTKKAILQKHGLQATKCATYEGDTLRIDT